MKDGNLFQYIHEANQIAQKLGHDGSQCRSRDSPFENQDGHGLQQDVYAQGYSKDYGWGPAVSQSPDDICLHEQKEEHHKAAVDDAYKGVGAIEYLRRGLHQYQ